MKKNWSPKATALAELLADSQHKWPPVGEPRWK